MARILIVDDDKEIGYLIQQYLNHDNDIFYAKNASDALELLNLYRFDLLIIDIEMPVCNGFQLAEKIQKSWKNRFIPYLFVSARNQKKDVQVALKLGAMDYLVKPLNKKILKERVEKYLNPQIQKNKLYFNISSGSLAEAHVIRTASIHVQSISETGIKFESTEKIADTDDLLKLDWDYLFKMGYSHTWLIVVQTRLSMNKWLYETHFYKPSYRFIDNWRNKVLHHHYKSTKNLMT